MTIPYAPDFVYPNGGEIITTPTLSISWTAPQVLDPNGVPTKFELFFTKDYSINQEPKWSMIAFLPPKISQFTWKIPNNIQNDKIRLGIRSVNAYGEKSEIKVSANEFTINRSRLYKPEVISPVSNGLYDSVLPITVNDKSSPKQSYYNLSYSSEKLNIPKTTLIDRVASNDFPYYVNVAEFTASDDYIFYVFALDNLGNTSPTAKIENVRISHSGFAIVDTLPPEMSIKLENDSIFTRKRNVTANIYGYDEATNVHAFQLKEVSPSDPNETVAAGTPQKYKNSSSYQLSSGDGIKSVSVFGQDFGGNEIGETQKRILLNILPLGGSSDVVDSEVYNNIVYAVSKGSVQNVYKIEDFSSLVQAVDEEPTSIVLFSDVLYVATKDADKKGHLYTKSLSGLTEVDDFSAYLDFYDVYISDMKVYQNSLVLGLSNGKLLEYDLAEISEIYSFDFPINKLEADNNILWIYFDNSTSIIKYDGTNIEEIETNNAY